MLLMAIRPSGRLWSEEEPEEPEPFGLNGVNQQRHGR